MQLSVAALLGVALLAASVQALEIGPTGATTLTDGVYNGPKDPTPEVKCRWETTRSNPVIAVLMAMVPGSVDKFLYLGRPGYEAGEAAGGIYDAAANTWRNITVASNTFCSSAAPLADGRIVVVGGHSATKFGLADGKNHIRIYDPDRPGVLPTVGRMGFNRWYPTATLLPDGSVRIAGGSIRPNEESPAPLVTEYWTPRTPGDRPRRTPVDPDYHKAVFQDYYPFDVTLPTGDIFNFNDGLSRIIKPDGTYYKDPATGGNWKGARFPGEVRTQYPRSSTYAMGALKPDASGQYSSVTLHVFGGAPRSNPCNHTPRSNSQPAIRKAFKSTLTWRRVGGEWRYTASAWEEEDAKIPRVGGDALLLPNGNILLFHGAQTGCAGGTKFGVPRANNPALWPELYQPNKPKGQRYTILQASTIARMYHNAAGLTLDGNVVIAGCDACFANQYLTSRASFWSKNTEGRFEYRNELFTTPYFLDMANKPRILTIAGVTGRGSIVEVKYGSQFTITYGSEGGGARVPVDTVSIVAPTSTTHGVNSNQKVAFLPATINRATGRITVTVPQSLRLALPPQHYMIFLLNKGTYSRGRWIKLEA